MLGKTRHRGRDEIGPALCPVQLCVRSSCVRLNGPQPHGRGSSAGQVAEITLYLVGAQTMYKRQFGGDCDPLSNIVRCPTVVRFTVMAQSSKSLATSSQANAHMSTPVAAKSRSYQRDDNDIDILHRIRSATADGAPDSTGSETHTRYRDSHGRKKLASPKTRCASPRAHPTAVSAVAAPLSPPLPQFLSLL